MKRPTFRTNFNANRGMSIVEGLISMAVLMIGILGALQGTIFASRQNAVAERLARATSMAAQVRMGLEAQSRATLMNVSTGALGNPANCVAMASLTPGMVTLTDTLNTTSVSGACVLDVDVFDSGATLPNKIVSNYDLATDYNGGKGSYRRIVVLLPSANGGADTMVVIVSTADAVRRYYVKQVVGLYNSTTSGNSTLVDL